MSATLLSVFLVLASADPADAEQVRAPQPQPSVHGTSYSLAVRSPELLRDAVNRALRHARSRRVPIKDAAAELVELYQELDRDTRLPRAERLELLSMTRSRLLRVGDSLAVKVQRALEDLEHAKLRVQRGAESPGETTQRQLARRYGLEGGGQNPVDHGAELVELIQTVIDPDQWDVNGGLASIYYFRPRHALVVRAPSEVQDNVGALLRQFRR